MRTEIPKPTLVDLLELTALIAFKQPQRHARVAARWLLKWLERNDQATIDDAALAAACLMALGGRSHRAALETLRDLAERPSNSLLQEPRR